MNLEQMQRRIEQVEASQREMNVIKQTLEDALKEDDKFQEIDLEAREIATKKKQIKDEIWGQPTYKEAQIKLKDLKEEVNDTMDILRHELLQWGQEHNTDEIIASDGTIRKFKISVRLQQLHNESS